MNMIGVSPTQANGDGSANRLRELERQLAEKEAQLKSRDQTVKELTERLAQAVERLDRVQRVGTDRITVSTAAFSKEVVQQQTELVEELQRAVELWQSMQLGAGLGHLELQFEDLRALIEEHFLEPEPIPEPEPEEAEAAADAPEIAAEENTNPEDPDPAEKQEDAEEPLDDGWDFASEEICPLRPPTISNLTEASLADFKRCVDQQEKYIEYLTNRLQRAAENPKSFNWDDLAIKPEALKTTLERTATKLEQSRNFAEYEVALQFTRLKRKERELKKVSDELTAQIQSLGGVPEADPNKDAPGNRRWMRMLGMGKAESE